MKLLFCIVCTVTGLLRCGGTAFAERNEMSLGLEASLLAPGFQSEDTTALSLATWSLGAFVQYGLLDDVFAISRVSFAAFRGSATHTEPFHAQILAGQLHFALTQVHVEAGARYKMFAGYNLAPYAELTCGILWARYSDQSFLDGQGRDFGLPILNHAESAFTIAAGVALDYRLMNMFFVGAAFRYVQAFAGMYARYVSVPLEFSYYF
jgi:hypothetical protein